MNTIFFDGNLVADVETRMTKNDKKFYTFRVASSNRSNGTNYYNVCAVGSTGDACAKYLKKGSKVVVRGELNTRVFERDGVKNISLDVNAENVVFGFSNNNSRADYEPPKDEKKSVVPELSLADADDDIPF